MSLLKRLRTSTIQQDAPKTLLPISSVDSILSTHPILNCMGLSIHDVHRVILDLNNIAKAKVVEGSPTVGSVEPNCPECCMGYLMLDRKEGIEVCDRCGAVTSSCVTVDDTFKSTEEVSNTARRKGSIDGVSDYMVKKASGAPRKHVPSFIEELEHWNQFTRVSTQDLEEIAYRLENWEGGTHSRNAKIAASLLYHSMKNVIPNEKDVRECVRQGKPLSEVGSGVRKPEFPCKDCGSLCFDFKTARFHCRNVYSRKCRKTSTTL